MSEIFECPSRLDLRLSSLNVGQACQRNKSKLHTPPLLAQRMLPSTRLAPVLSFSNSVDTQIFQVRVPVGNTLGKVGAGMSVILSNFNHERWMVCATSVAAQRLIVEECLK